MKALAEVRGTQRVTDPEPEGKYQALEKYTRDLTELARTGKLDPVIGRDEEIRRSMQVLSRRTKNNPVLIGEPGRRQDRDRRGHRAAHRHRRRARVAQGQADPRARSRRADRRHQVPRRVRGAPQGGAEGGRGRRGRRSSCSSTSCTRWSAPARAEGAVGRGQHAQAGARARRAALHRRDDARRVPQAHREGQGARAPLPAGVRRRAVASRTRSRSCAGSRRRYEVHHGIRIRDAALVAAARLSDRYITGRQLPDKAIDLVDEAASRLKMEIDSRARRRSTSWSGALDVARDRASGARQGERRGVGEAARRRSSAEIAELRERVDDEDALAAREAS